MRVASTSLITLALMLGAAQAGAQSGTAESADARWQRLQAERAAEAARQRAAQEAYEQGVRDAAAARARYEADTARHNREVERARTRQADYQRARADYEAQTGTAARPPSGESRRDRRRREREARNENERCERRARGRGRLIGGVLGGIAGGIVGRSTGNPIAGLATALPVSLLLADAITNLLDCREREQAAEATETAIAQATAPPAAGAGTPGAPGGAPQRGVGTTVAWSSETRPGVTGSSTITGLEQEAGGGECMTVTDIVIVDGQETRAPKRMCRRPPSQRFVRV